MFTIPPIPQHNARFKHRRANPNALAREPECVSEGTRIRQRGHTAYYGENIVTRSHVTLRVTIE